MDALPTNRTWQPSCSHGTYQHKAITSRSRQLLMMGTWLPKTCWATIRREIKIQKVTSSWFFLSTLNYDARSTTQQTHTSFARSDLSIVSILRIQFFWYMTPFCWVTDVPTFRKKVPPLHTFLGSFETGIISRGDGSILQKKRLPNYTDISDNEGSSFRNHIR